MNAKMTGLIPARGGSLRVAGKNIRYLQGHPLIAYSIQSARDSGIFSSIVVATDSEDIAEIAEFYEVDEVFMRDPKNAIATSLDIEWLESVQKHGLIQTDSFAILRPTSPFRTSELIRKVDKAFAEAHTDSIRTVAKVKEHPGKMWRLDKTVPKMQPFIEQNTGEVASHAKQYQALESLHIQTSVLEMAMTTVITDYGVREGRTIAPFVTDGVDSLAIDTELDWQIAKMLVDINPNLLPTISIPPFPREHAI